MKEAKPLMGPERNVSALACSSESTGLINSPFPRASKEQSLWLLWDLSAPLPLKQLFILLTGVGPQHLPFLPALPPSTERSSLELCCFAFYSGGREADDEVCETLRLFTSALPGSLGELGAGFGMIYPRRTLTLPSVGSRSGSWRDVTSL